MSINVIVRNGNLEQAMRVLKRKVQKEGLVKELRERQFYKKPSEVKQEKKKEAIKNWKKRQKLWPLVWLMVLRRHMQIQNAYLIKQTTCLWNLSCRWKQREWLTVC